MGRPLGVRARAPAHQGCILRLLRRCHRLHGRARQPAVFGRLCYIFPVSDSSILSALTDSVIEAAEDLGFNRAALLTEAAIEPAWLEDPDARVPLHSHLAVWAALSRKPVGIELGLRLGLSGLGVVGYAMPHTESVGAALAFLDRYRTLIHSDAVPRLEQRTIDGEARFAYVQLVPAPFARLVEPVDAQAAAAVALIRTLAGDDVDPTRVALQRPEPPKRPNEKSPQERFHRCAIAWNAPLLEVEFRADILKRPLRRTDARLLGYLSRRAEELRAQLPDDVGFQARVKREIGLRLAQGEPSLKEIASRLGVSERTLHRRLAQENARFQTLLDEIRHERALLLLGNARLSAAEVSALLGYTDSSAFFRAFRRWTGQTPQAFRRHHPLG